MYLFIELFEIKIRYRDILHLMPDDYNQTLKNLQNDISDDEIAGILGCHHSNVANKQILDCLIQKIETREKMLDFCDQLEKISTSQDLRTIIVEIQTGKYVW